MRSYPDRAIAPADLDRILEAGWRSPSASNRQKWDSVVITDRAKLDEQATVWQGAGHLRSAAAADLGIGSCHSSIGDKAAAQRILGFPDGHEASYMLSFGYPADRRSSRSCIRAGARSTRSSTVAAGSRR